MTYFSNHVGCNEPLELEDYGCRYQITIERNLHHENYHDGPNEDWENNIEKRKFFNQEEFNTRIEWLKEDGEYTEEKANKMKERLSKMETNALKPHVIEWLNENVKDRNNKGKIEKGWEAGSDAYRYRQRVSINVFFHRRQDALNFVKEHSIFIKPTLYYDYFKDKRVEMKTKDIKDIQTKYQEALNKKEFIENEENNSFSDM